MSNSQLFSTVRPRADFRLYHKEYSYLIAARSGHTTTTLCGALPAFYGQFRVAHVEAGLRSFDRSSPFPEETNRILTTRLASLHFAPTELAAENLRNEGVPPESVVVTGNTGIDAVRMIRAALESEKVTAKRLAIQPLKRVILVTAHRRESFGPQLEQICNAVLELAKRGDVEIVWPTHPNPNVQDTTHRVLSCAERVHLIAPLGYVSFVELMTRSHLLLTDSGGIQEEAVSLGKPVLVLRNKTEHTAGASKLVGTTTSSIVREVNRILEDDDLYSQMVVARNIYGDGLASKRIAYHIARAVRNGIQSMTIGEDTVFQRDRSVF